MSNAKMEYKGADIDEAINNACVSLNAKREDLEIEIISTGSVGIFGLGKKKAVIRVSLRGGTGKTAASKPEKKQRPKAEEPARPAKKPRPEKDEAGKPARKARPVAEEDEEGEREEQGGEPLSAEELAVIQANLAKLLELMGCPAEVTASQDADNKVQARIDGGDQETIIGPEGQTLDGLQYLLRKIVTRLIPKKVVLDLDAGNFRETRRQELEERARTLAAEVKATGKARTIPAINPAERRIVHLVLQQDQEIRSRSVGEGLFKKVLIYLPGKGGSGGGRRRPSRRRRPSTQPRDNS